MSNFVDMNVRVPIDLYDNLVKISSFAKSDLNTDLVHLFECYVDTGKEILRDPAARILLGVK